MTANTLVTVVVELQLGGVWVDITGDVYKRDRVQITRGRRDEGSAADPARCTMTINNKSGKYDPRNPLGPYYGQIGRNTPIRVSVEGHVRFLGEVSAWPPRWDVSESDVYVPIEAAGIKRRLSQGSKPLQSALRRVLSLDENVVAYWPLEDTDSAGSVASGLLGAPPMRILGAPDFGAYSDIAGSLPLPTMGKGAFSGTVPAHVNTGFYQLQFIVSVPEAGTSTQRLISLYTAGAGSQAHRWDLRYESGGLGAARLRAYDEEENLLEESATQLQLNGNPSLIQVTLDQNGSDVAWSFFQWRASSGRFLTGLDGTFTGRTLHDAVGVTVAGFRNLGDVAFGHVALATAVDPVPDDVVISPLLGWAGELAGARLQRLCAEAGITLYAGGDLATTPPMGIQKPKTLIELLTECEEVDGGILHELRDEVGLSYRPASSLYNQVTPA